MDNLYSPSHPAEDAAQYRERVMGILREPSRAAGDEGAGDGRAVAPRSRSRLVRHLPSHRRIPPHLREMILRPPTSPDQHFDFDVDAIRRQLRGDIA